MEALDVVIKGVKFWLPSRSSFGPTKFGCYDPKVGDQRGPPSRAEAQNYGTLR